VACRGKSAWGRKPGVITVLADSPLIRHFDFTFLADLYALTPLESTLRRIMEMYSSC
jgi:hypothetical protein